MEPPSKRQRLSRVAGRPSSVGSDPRGSDDCNLTSAEVESNDREGFLDQNPRAEASPPDHPLELRTLSVPPNTQTWSAERRRAVEGRHRRLHNRRRDNLLDSQRPADVAGPILVKTLTIVDTVGVVGTDPGIVVFPTTPTMSPSLDTGATPGPTVPTSTLSAPLTTSTAPSYPFITASATETGLGGGNSSNSTRTAESSSKQVPLGASSQMILSSPPSTPLPSSPSMTLPPSSSGSFNSTSSSSNTASTESAVSQTTPAPAFLNSIQAVNGSAPTIILTNNSTTFTAANVITTSLLASNSSTSIASSNITSFSSTSPSSSISLNTTTSTSLFNISSTTTTTISSTSITTSSSSSTTAGNTGVGAGGAGIPTGSGATGAPTGEAGGGNASGGGSGPSTPAVVGGVVGGLAGLALLLVLILMFLRWRKRKQRGLQQTAVAGQEGAPPQSRSGDAPSSEAMTQRSSLTPFAAAGFLKRFRPTSQQTATTTETTPSERGFVNLGGRKLPSVFGPAGGDGYGGGYNREVLSGSSFYRDSQGFYGGPGAAGPSTTTTISGPSRQPGQRPESDVPVLRPSPARTPVTSEGPVAPIPAPPRGPPAQRRQNSPDGIGRSHPSFDGSRGSRFREEVE